jgi:tetratricopeptide (TPR) repeat protein
MSRVRQKRLKQRRPLEKLLPFVLVILAAMVGWRVWQSTRSPERLLSEARRALAACDYAAVERLCQEIGLDAEQSPEALELAAEAALKQNRVTDAAAYYEQMPKAAGEAAAKAYLAAGDLWLQLGQASRAEAQYRRALDIDPVNLTAHDRLANLMAVEGRRFESLPHLYELLRQGQYSVEVLLLAGEHSKNMEDAEELERLRAAAPDDPTPLIGFARIEMSRQNLLKTRELLKQAIVEGPQYVEAHALLGRLLLESPDDRELAAWQAALPADADWHPDIWAVRAGWAKRRGQLQAAARCYWEALRRDANHQVATLQLSQLLHALGDTRIAEDLAQRAAVLTEFSATLNQIFMHREELSFVIAAARSAETLGRLWEAWGWNQLALSRSADVKWARDALARIEPQLKRGPPPTLPERDPGKLLDLSHLPLPDERDTAPSTGDDLAAKTAAQPHFADVAQRLGIDFTYFCGRDPGNPRDRMFQSLGGGAAVLDYDLDGWPDLYFTQGCRWPPRARQIEHLDTLYRNLTGERFVEVTRLSRLGDERFSQGAAIGDFDNDGFPDLYVANIGVNRLYRNNGDGTFSDVSDAAGIISDQWTTSCLLADLNGDGFADIYDVNYLQGRDVYERTCPVDGLPRTCTPGLFEPAPDAFFLNLGDGRFQEATEESGFSVWGGNGLGIVACDFSGTGQLNLFVANDQDANFYFVNETPAAGDRPGFVERGLLAGVAFDGEGRALASMGVAAGDVDGDGRIDLLVTNFDRESSTLYLQDGPDSFTDATGRAGLREPSYAMLGFGAQFLDGELDGLLDLVVTNGHVHEFSSPGVSYAMRPQYFRNRGGGHFEELAADALGDYFQRTYFGRGLARLDFNRDGLDDFAVSSLETPASLVRNESDGAGHYLALQLHGVQSSRDAIGAIVTVEVGARSYTQWLNAGDGFHASNERRRTFGLGSAKRVDGLRISWPSGLVQEFTDLAADQELILVEGAPLPAPLPR